MGKLRAFWKDETAAVVAIEYGLVTAGISVLIIAAVFLYRPTH
jgi:Flp pilus assembly pilin Flp